jgi:hypothetical protein
MIRVPTVLVLGAGASVPYGFPSGRELLFEIAEELAPGTTSNLSRDLQVQGFIYEEIAPFRDHLLESHLPSVDAFLENRPAYLEIGKTAIAIKLIQKEDKKNLLRRRKMDWYEYLFNQMGTQLNEFMDTQLAIITLNYDRSLEYFLYTSIRSAFGLSHEDSAELLRSMRIVHFYGQLAPLDVIDHNGRPYETEVRQSTLQKAVSGIKILVEGKEASPQIHEARALIKATEVLAFLGFGYHPANVNRLALDSVFHGTALGTAYGMGEDEKRRAQALTSKHKIWFGSKTETNLNFLRNYPVFR